MSASLGFGEISEYVFEIVLVEMHAENRPALFHRPPEDILTYVVVVGDTDVEFNGVTAVSAGR